MDCIAEMEAHLKENPDIQAVLEVIRSSLCAIEPTLARITFY